MYIVLVIDFFDILIDQYLNDFIMIEVILIKGKKGVMYNYVGECIWIYKGDIWWLLLYNDVKILFEQNWF